MMGKIEVTNKVTLICYFDDLSFKTCNNNGCDYVRSGL